MSALYGCLFKPLVQTLQHPGNASNSWGQARYNLRHSICVVTGPTVGWLHAGRGFEPYMSIDLACWLFSAGLLFLLCMWQAPATICDKGKDSFWCWLSSTWSCPFSFVTCGHHCCLHNRKTPAETPSVSRPCYLTSFLGIDHLSCTGPGFKS